MEPWLIFIKNRSKIFIFCIKINVKVVLDVQSLSIKVFVILIIHCHIDHREKGWFGGGGVYV